jgi:hypothetical protein
MTKPKKPFRLIFATLVLGICIYFAICFIALIAPKAVDKYANQRPFDSELWKKSDCGDQGNNYPRLDMVDDLLEKHDLTKMTKTQIIELLGETADIEKNSWFYCLGPQGFGVDYDLLKIQFNEKDQVIEYIITRS